MEMRRWEEDGDIGMFDCEPRVPRFTPFEASANPRKERE